MQLHQSTMRVEFNPLKLKEIDEAKKKYIQAREQSRIIHNIDGVAIDRFDPNSGGFIIRETQLAEDQFAMRIFDETGDKRVIWNASNPDEVREASGLFDDYLKKGWKPYAIDRHGNMGKRIRRFDADLQEIIFDDSSSEKLKSFGSKFKEIKMMPRTYPG